MCDERKFIETIHCKEGDCLIFAVDTDIYDLEDLNDTVKDLQRKIPGVKIAVIPSDLVDNIIYINNNTIPLTTVISTIDNASGCPTRYTTYCDEDLNSGWSKLD